MKQYHITPCLTHTVMSCFLFFVVFFINAIYFYLYDYYLAKNKNETKCQNSYLLLHIKLFSL